MNFDRPLFDHERQTEDHQQDTDGLILGATSKAASKSTTKEKVVDQTDWRRYLRLDANGDFLPLPKGYRLVPEETLSKSQKAARTHSIKKAIAKRGKRQPVKVPVYQKGERRAVYADLVKRTDDSRISYGDPYALLPPYETRAWEIELRKALDWFVDAFAGEPERPDEKLWRERAERHKSFADAHFGNDPADGWDWTFEVPERGDLGFHERSNWNSPHMPPRYAKAFLEAKLAAQAKEAPFEL
ncbi:hypothetical protein [Mesorhizobium escarrei]|uniref:Uncharacterized protein n=1 Tax=Mesorhizobium escarrei TaxID=666018 RepID=A0ABN8JN84_9HYPH|nr:hypothetical protein [Mesorhizobium escarrei]CAH2399613.1 conserved hypothetical protein [Mesorhizobium escarrei]